MSDLYNLYIYILAPLAAFLAIIWTLIRLTNYIIPPRRVVNQYSSPSSIRIVQLRRKASEKTLWNVIKTISIVISVVMLLFMGLLAFATIKSGIPFEFNPLSVFLLALMIGFPVYLLVSTIRDDKRVREGTGSRVAERVELELFGDYQSVVEQCRRTLSAMGAWITHLDAEQGAIKAELKNNRVIIQITKIQDMHHQMSIVSDAAWPTVRFDRGENKKIVNDLIKML